jgi:MSHA biogenesis protein MshL
MLKRIARLGIVFALLSGALPGGPARPSAAAALEVAAVAPELSDVASELPADLPSLTLITNGWVDVRQILRNVARTTGVGLQMAPDVSGEVNLHLEEVPFGRALDALLEPVDLGYEFVDGVLVVYRRGMVTRWFTFDYPVTEREGRGELEVTARAQESGESSSGSESGGNNENRSHITSTATMTVWPDVVSSLRTIIFAGSEVAREQTGGQQLAVSLADVSGRVLVVNPMAGLVQVTAEFDRVQEVARLLERLQESLQRQVAIEVRILEVSLDGSESSGVNWATVTGEDWDVSLQANNPDIGDNLLSFVVDTDKIAGILDVVATDHDVRIISTPRITTLNNQKAIVRVVTEEVFFEAQVEPMIVTNQGVSQPVVNYTPRVIPVGVVLDVTPQVGRDSVITLNVHPSISNILRIAESPNEDTAPVISIRELDTVGKVSDGETLVIAGLVREGTVEHSSGVPILKDLPLLGMLFGSKSQQKIDIELVMMLTPIVLNPDRIGTIARDAEDRIREKL